MHELMSELRRLNVRLWVEDGKLHFAAPGQVLSADLKRRMADRKSELIQAIEQASAAPAAPSRPKLALAADPAALSFAQQRLLFLHQIDSQSYAYNVPAAWRIAGPLDGAALERALALLPARHDALRSAFAPTRPIRTRRSRRRCARSRTSCAWARRATSGSRTTTSSRRC